METGARIASAEQARACGHAQLCGRCGNALNFGFRQDAEQR